MSTIKDKLYFNFDGKNSKDYGLMSISLSGGMFEEMLFPSREINETEVQGREQPIFHSVKESRRTDELILAFENKYAEQNIRDIEEWLIKGYYKPLFFEGNPDRIMYCMLSGDFNIAHNGLGEGYITLGIQTNSPYLQTREKIRSVTITTSGSIPVTNNGSKDVYPQLSIKKRGDGDLTIGIDGRNVLIANLKNGEDIFIDTKKDIIKTNLVGQYRYDNIRAGELDDLYVAKHKTGTKEYKITGGCDFSYRFREKYRF